MRDFKNLNPMLKLVEFDGYFFEVYKQFRKYGLGVMLCYRFPNGKLEYVKFHKNNSKYKEIINEELYNLYIGEE